MVERKRHDDVVGQPVGGHLVGIGTTANFGIAFEVERLISLFDVADGDDWNVVAISERARMGPWQMSFIHEVFHRSCGARLPSRRADNMSEEAFLLEFGHFVDRRLGLAQTHEHKPVALDAMKFLRLGLRRYRAIGRYCRDFGYRTALVVTPAMIGTDKLIPLDPSKRQASAPVDAQVLECGDPGSCPPDHQRNAQQGRGDGLCVQLRAERNGMPEINQRIMRQRRHTLSRAAAFPSRPPGAQLPRHSAQFPLNAAPVTGAFHKLGAGATILSDNMTLFLGPSEPCHPCKNQSDSPAQEGKDRNPWPTSRYVARTSPYDR